MLRQKWSRGQIEARLANMPQCLIGMEACVGAHHLSRMQAQGHMQMMVRMGDYGLGPQGAIDGPRFRIVHGVEVNFEREWPKATLAELAARGHKVVEQPESCMDFGCAQIAHRLEDGYLAASDARRDSLAVGF